MNLRFALSQLDVLYGQVRGYRRLTIQRRTQQVTAWTREQVLHQQLLDFRRHVHRSIARFPFYADKVRQHLGNLPQPGDEFTPSDLPLWTKEDQRGLFDTLDPAEFGDCFLHASGGSSGEPTRFYMSRESFEWRTAVTRRGYALAHAEPGRRSLFLWGEPAQRPSRKQRWKTQFHSWLENRHFFPCFHFDAQQMQRCCEVINHVRPVALVGYAGRLAELAAFCREHPGSLSWQPPHIVTAAEGLQGGQRQLLESQFGGRVFLSYGSREFMLIGMETGDGLGYALSDDNLLVEVVDDAGQPLPPGQEGHLAISDLHNAANPFIRYLIGDLGSFSPDSSSSTVRLPFGRLREVWGRQQEFVWTPTGNRLTLLYFAHNLKEFAWIDAFQIVQHARDHLSIRIRSSQPLAADQRRQVVEQLRPQLVDVQIDVVQVAQLTRRANGKIPTLLREDSPAQRQSTCDLR